MKMKTIPLQHLYLLHLSLLLSVYM